MGANSRMTAHSALQSTGTSDASHAPPPLAEPPEDADSNTAAFPDEHLGDTDGYRSRL